MAEVFRILLMGNTRHGYYDGRTCRSAGPGIEKKRGIAIPKNRSETVHIFSSARILFLTPANDFTSITALAPVRRIAAITGIKLISPSPTGLWVSFFPLLS